MSDQKVANGDYCTVIAGTHKGKSGIVEDRNLSKTGHVTITVMQEDGTRFKAIARNVSVRGALTCVVKALISRP